MTATIYISRAFVEFGPFLPEEIIAFEKRGLLREIDHIRHHGKDDWIPLAAWLASTSSPVVAPAKTAPTKKASSTPATKAAPKATKKAAPVKKAAPAKKAAAKKAPKS